VREANEVRGRAGWWEFIRRARSPELPVVLLEDLGALLGLGFALVGIGLAVWTGDSRFDALGSVAIGILLGVIAVVLASEMKSLLIGESANAGDRQRIVEAIESAGPVRRLIHLRTQHLGPEELLVTAKVEFDPELAGRALADAIDGVEDRIRAAVPVSRLVFLEPDVYRPERTVGEVESPPGAE
jgi:divalent metal cation (Fe/Co/Zn/Cd) transporter